jgi:dTDP-4-dehydrorhamnose 3,5-epimerase
VDVTPTSLPGVVLITLDTFADDRGFFVERYRDERFATTGLPTVWRQDNHSRSRRGVLRGLHYQLSRPQGKLVSCISGSVFDVAVDVRVGSPTFGKWVGVTLTGDAPQLLWIPPGFAHGFCTTSDVADVTYKCTDVYVPDDERGIIWNDPELAIRWPLSPPILSRRDREFPSLKHATALLPQYRAAPSAP